MEIGRGARYMFSKGTNEYVFPKAVLGPEATQQDVYDTMIPAYVEAFVSGRNATFMAYGQTGTGKTSLLSFRSVR